MKILNFGSLNLDLVYQIPHFVRAGETLSTTGFSRNVGGKGLNQSVALAKAGAEVYHAGMVGADGEMLRTFLSENGVDVRFVRTIDQPSGHAVIQVVPEGNNCIFLYGGANQCVTAEMIETTLNPFRPGDLVLLQNEINLVPEIIRAARQRGLQVALNPSPASPDMKAWPLNMVDWLLLNEVEGADLTGCADPQQSLDALLQRYPACRIVLTLGSDGAMYADAQQRVHQAAFRVQAVDTTAAGDTFTGYFLQSMLSGHSPADALLRACCASAIAVCRPGASASIPHAEEVALRLAALSPSRCCAESEA